MPLVVIVWTLWILEFTYVVSFVPAGKVFVIIAREVETLLP